MSTSIPEINNTDETTEKRFRRRCHNLQDIIGVHLIHGSSKNPAEYYNAGLNVQARTIGVLDPTYLFDTLLANPFYRHIYALSSGNCLLPYEYREGHVPNDMTRIDHVFFWELSQYLRSNKLRGVLALEG